MEGERKKEQTALWKINIFVFIHWDSHSEPGLRDLRHFNTYTIYVKEPIAQLYKAPYTIGWTSIVFFFIDKVEMYNLLIHVLYTYIGSYSRSTTKKTYIFVSIPNTNEYEKKELHKNVTGI